jgi:hypothetical protein
MTLCKYAQEWYYLHMELITVTEAARRAGVRREAIYYSIKAGKIKANREYGNVLVDANELTHYKPRASVTRVPPRRHVTGLGKFASVLSSTEEYFARKAEEKALER